MKVACTLSGGSATSKAASKAIKVKHNPAPAEGGRARVMSAHHLGTALTAGGSCQWVPESEVALGTKYINVDNKTYKASDDGKYGWSEVVVSGIYITKDGDTITHTDGTGTVTYVLPTEIRVVNPPYKLRYADGEAIDYTGMVVKAYTASGSLWSDADHPGGIIPIDELTLPVTEAELIGGGAGNFILPPRGFDDIRALNSNSSLSGVWPINAGAVTYDTYMGVRKVINCDYYVLKQTQFEYYQLITISYEKLGPISWELTPYTFAQQLYSTGSGSSDLELLQDGEWKLANNTTLDFTDIENAIKAFFGIGDEDKLYFDFDQAYNPSGVAWMAHGTADVRPGNGPVIAALPFAGYPANFKYIPVQWNRPFDFELLETDFEIQISETGYGGATGGGGQTSGGGAGRDH